MAIEDVCEASITTYLVSLNIQTSVNNNIIVRINNKNKNILDENSYNNSLSLK